MNLQEAKFIQQLKKENSKLKEVLEKLTIQSGILLSGGSEEEIKDSFYELNKADDEARKLLKQLNKK